ncbi:MAG: hypothetical protein ACREQ9_05545 [Candidatus Binatia bacterium]
MARLSAAEFEELIGELANVEGLAKLQEKIRRSHAVVSRRNLGSVQTLARQLYQLTLGLDRDGLASQVVLALWEDFLKQKLDEDATKQLEALADKINGCLISGKDVDPARESELRTALAEYRADLAKHVGDAAARLTMLTRAYPAVARLVREPASGA